LNLPPLSFSFIPFSSHFNSSNFFIYIYMNKVFKLFSPSYPLTPHSPPLSLVQTPPLPAGPVLPSCSLIL
jgi:hypothetical protein